MKRHHELRRINDAYERHKREQGKFTAGDREWALQRVHAEEARKHGLNLLAVQVDGHAVFEFHDAETGVPVLEWIPDKGSGEAGGDTVELRTWDMALGEAVQRKAEHVSVGGLEF